MIFGCGKPGVVTNPGRIVCTSTPEPRSDARSERENATWAYFEAEYGAAGLNDDRAADRRDRGDVGASRRRRRGPEPGEEAARDPDAAEVVDGERPLDLVERGIDERATHEDAGAVDEEVDRRDAARGCARSSPAPRRGPRRRRPPPRRCPPSSEARRWSSSSRRATSTQRQPRSASSRAVASPMPEDAPVTTATRRDSAAALTRPPAALAWKARFFATALSPSFAISPGATP